MSDTALTSFTPKTFLQRPEGKLGLALPIIAIVTAVVIMGSAIGDFLVNALANTLELTILASIVVGIFMFRKPLFYMYRSLCRLVTGWFIEIDPIGILKTYKERLSGKLEEMRRSIDLLNGQKIKVERIISKNNADIDRSMGLVQQAVKVNDERVKGLEGKQAVRLQQENQRIGTDYNRIVFLLTVLNRYYQLSQDQITDMGREIESKQRERDYSRASQSAIRSAMGILKGLPSEKEMYDQSLEVLEQQYSNAIGEVEHFLDLTKDIVATSDLQNGADADKAMKMLDEWQKKNSGMVIGATANGVTKANIIQDAQKQIQAAPVTFTINTGKPQYKPASTNASKDDDYLSMVK